MIDRHEQQAIANFRHFVLEHGSVVLTPLTDDGFYVVEGPGARVSTSDYGADPALWIALACNEGYQQLDSASLRLEPAGTPQQAQLDLIFKLRGRWILMPGADEAIPAPRLLPDVRGFEEVRHRDQIYRRMIANLAKAIWNEEGWDKQSVASILGMLDERADYLLPPDMVPDTLTTRNVYEALDHVVEEAGL